MTAPSPVLEHILQQQVEGTNKLHKPNNRLLSEMKRSCKPFRHVGNMATSRCKWVSKVAANQAD